VGATDTLVATWPAAAPGNSPIDQYLVTISGSDGAGTFTNTVSGTTLSTYFIVDYIPNWSVTVQAHNAFGWGPVSSAFNLGGL
jgi:predicted secreted protein